MALLYHNAHIEKKGPSKRTKTTEKTTKKPSNRANNNDLVDHD